MELEKVYLLRKHAERVQIFSTSASVHVQDSTVIFNSAVSSNRSWCVSRNDITEVF